MSVWEGVVQPHTRPQELIAVYNEAVTLVTHACVDSLEGKPWPPAEFTSDGPRGWAEFLPSTWDDQAQRTRIKEALQQSILPPWPSERNVASLVLQLVQQATPEASSVPGTSAFWFNVCMEYAEACEGKADEALRHGVAELFSDFQWQHNPDMEREGGSLWSRLITFLIKQRMGRLHGATKDLGPCFIDRGPLYEAVRTKASSPAPIAPSPPAAVLATARALTWDSPSKEVQAEPSTSLILATPSRLQTEVHGVSSPAHTSNEGTPEKRRRLELEQRDHELNSMQRRALANSVDPFARIYSLEQRVAEEELLLAAAIQKPVKTKSKSVTKKRATTPKQGQTGLRTPHKRKVTIEDLFNDIDATARSSAKTNAMLRSAAAIDSKCNTKI